jgi:hypothetical protein
MCISFGIKARHYPAIYSIEEVQTVDAPWYVTWVDSGGVGKNEDIFYTWNSTAIPATGGLPLILPRVPSVAVYCNNFSFVVYERSFTHATTFNVVDSKGNIVGGCGASFSFFHFRTLKHYF